MRTITFLLLFATITPAQTARPTERQRFDRAMKFNTCAGYKMLITFPNGDQKIQGLDSWVTCDGVLRTSSNFSGQKIRSLTLVDDENYTIYTKQRPGTISKLDIRPEDVSNEPAIMHYIEGCRNQKCPEMFHFLYVV